MQNAALRFAQVFWGLAIVGVDLNLGGFDVLPDFAGYALIALGLSGLATLSSQFNPARLLGWILVPLAILPLIFSGQLVRFTGLLRVALDVALLWLLLGGVKEYAERRERSDLATRAPMLRLAYAVLGVTGVVIGWFSGALPNLARLSASITFVAGLIVLGLILHLLYQVKGLGDAPAAAETPAAPAPAPGQDLDKAA